MSRAKIEKRSTLIDILKDIEDLVSDPDSITIFRGHISFRHKLRPGLFRVQNERIRSHERVVLRELITKHPHDFSDDLGVFEKLVRMQHYGLPTRLLDVTYNPLVAIYFACELSSNEDPEVIIIKVDKDHFKYFDSDTVRCIANLSNLSQAEQNEIKLCADSTELKVRTAGTRLVDFILQERPNFIPRINLDDLKNFYLVSPRLNNPRIQAQNGAFLIFGIEEEIKSKTKGFEIKRIRIDKNAVQDIKKSVELLGITESLIYPEISRTSEVIKRKYSAHP